MSPGAAATPRRARSCDAWQDRADRRVIAVRGGYGSVEMLPLLDAERLGRARTAFVGYSDVTSLLTLARRRPSASRRSTARWSKAGSRRGRPATIRDTFLSAALRAEPLAAIARPARSRSFKPGEAAGTARWRHADAAAGVARHAVRVRPADGHVLFLDEVGERPYRLDRMLTQLRLSGRLARRVGRRVRPAAGLRRAGRQPVTRATSSRDCCADFAGPVLFGFPSGHTTTPTLTLPLRRPTRVVVDARRRRRSSSKKRRSACRMIPAWPDVFISSASAAPRWRRWRPCSRRAASTCRDPTTRLSADERLPRARAASRCFDGYDAEHITADLDLVVVGNAISRGNPELEEVLDRKIRFCSLPEAIRDQFLWGSRGRSSSPARTARPRRRR